MRLGMADDVDDVRLQLHLQADGGRQMATSDVRVGRIGSQPAARLTPDAELAVLQRFHHVDLGEHLAQIHRGRRVGRIVEHQLLHVILHPGGPGVVVPPGYAAATATTSGASRRLQ